MNEINNMIKSCFGVQIKFSINKIPSLWYINIKHMTDHIIDYFHETEDNSWHITKCCTLIMFTKKGAWKYNNKSHVFNDKRSNLIIHCRKLILLDKTL